MDTEWVQNPVRCGVTENLLYLELRYSPVTEPWPNTCEMWCLAQSPTDERAWKENLLLDLQHHGL